MNYYFINNKSHPLLALTESRLYHNLPVELRQYIRQWEFVEATSAITVFENKSLVGVFRYMISTHGEIVHLAAAGTWVSESMRGKDIAATMWNKAIRKNKPHGVYVYTTSLLGHKLVASLKQKHNKISWYHTSDFSFI